jgi:hypothetical protein
VHELRPQTLGESGGVGEVTEKYGDLLALSFEGTLAGEDLLGQVLGGVGVRLSVIDGRRFLGPLQIPAALVAKLEAWRWNRSAIWTTHLQRCAAIPTKYRVFRILKLAFWAFHFYTLQLKG